MIDKGYPALLIFDSIISMLIISGISLACLGLYSRRFVGRIPAAAPYALLMFTAFAWTILYALELMAGTLGLKIIFHNLRFIVLPFMGVIELWLVIAFVDRTEWLRKDWAVAVLILPVAAAVLGITSPLLTLFRYNFSLDSSGPVTVLRYTEGTFYTIFGLYSLVLLTLAIVILVIESRKRGTLWQAQTVLLIIALAFPTVINYLFLLGLTPVQGINMTAPLLWISAVLYTIALFRFRLLDIIPIARSRVIEEMGTPMIVIDAGGTVLDLNPAAGSLLGGLSQPLVGKQVRELVPDWAEFLAFCETGSGSHAEFTRREGQGTRTYSGSIDMLYSASGSPEGKLILLADITDRKRAEEEMQRQSANLSILNGIISTANKADDLPRLLDSILALSLRLMDFDAGGIYLVDSTTRTANVVRSMNIPPEFLAQIKTVPVDAKPYDTLFIKKEPIFTENYDKIASGQLGKSGFQSMASIPLLSKGVTIGALNIASRRRQVLSEDEKLVLTSIGWELGSTIERMAAEEEVKKTRENLETLFNSIDEMVFVLDMEGKILKVNNTVTKRLSFTPEELTGTSVLLLHVPERRDEAFRTVQGMIAGTIDSCPVPVLAKDGAPIEIETKVTRGWWNNQEVLFGVSRDVTKRKLVEEALKKSEEQYRLLYDHAVSAVAVHEIVLDPDGKPADSVFMSANPAFQTHTGLCAAEVIGHRISCIIPGIEKSPFIEECGKVVLTGVPVTFEQYIEPLSRHLLINAYKVGERRFATVFTDITRSKLAEERLMKSENLLRSVIESPQSIIIFSLDRNYQYLAFNARHGETMKAIWGIDIQPGMNMLEVIGYEGDRKKAQQNFDRALRGEHFTLTEEYGDEVMGRMTWENTYSPIYDENHRVTGITVYVIDVTERRRALEALRQLSDRLSLAVQAGGIGIWDYNIVNNSLTWDDQMFALYGITRAQFSGAYEAWRTGVHPDDRMRGDAEIQMALQGEKVFDTEFRVLWPDRTIRTIRALAIVQRDANGTPVRMIGTNWDITAEKNAERAISQANRKLNLLSSITRHDINNQLTVMIGFLGLLEDSRLDPRDEEYLRNVTTASERIATIIRFTKEYESIGVIAPAWQDCRSLVDTSASYAPLGTVKVVNDLPSRLEVFADPLVVKVCYNLMDNAVRYGGKITTIRFSAIERDSDQVIICEDDGVGIPVHEKKKIFERGFGKNTGLGLFLSREILSITGITINETGEPGRGARFEMTMPNGIWRMAGGKK